MVLDTPLPPQVRETQNDHWQDVREGDEAGEVFDGGFLAEGSGQVIVVNRYCCHMCPQAWEDLSLSKPKLPTSMDCSISAEARVSHLPSYPDTYNPTALDNTESWSKVGQLVLLSTLSTIGSVGNVFLISTVLMKKPLKRRGNSFIVNVALADLLITGLAVPSSIIALLSGLSDWRPICRIQWSITIISAFVSAPSMGFLGVDARIFVGLEPETYRRYFTPCRFGSLIGVIWLVSGCCFTAFLALQQLPDICRDTEFDSKIASGWKWHIPSALAGLIILLPMVMGLAFGISTIFKIKSEKALSPMHRLGKPNFDDALVQTNLAVLLVYGATHTPLVVAMAFNTRRDVPYTLYVQLLWVAMVKAVLNPLVYAICHRQCRETFISLFEYCCCKTSVNFSRRVRQETIRPTSEVRVHIIPGYNMYSTAAQNSRATAASTSYDYSKITPHRQSTAVKSSQKVKGKSKNFSKQIYEL